MDNKNEKTFADLFSSSTENEETKKETFSDILNNKPNETLENETKQEKNLTFDNIFDSLPSQAENPSTELPQEDIKKTNENEIAEQSGKNTFNSLLAEEDKINLEEPGKGTQSFNSFNSFLEAEDEVYDSNVDNKEEEILPDLGVKPKEQSSFSDIFNETKTSVEEDSKTISNNDNIDDSKPTTTNITETQEDNNSFNNFLSEEKNNTVKEETSEENNLINFEKKQNVDVLEKEEPKTNVELKESEDLETKDIKEETATQDLKEEVVQETASNPFFQEELAPQETKSNETENTDTANPFLTPNQDINNEVTKDTETSNPTINPFFNDDNNENNKEESVENNVPEEAINNNLSNENPFFNIEGNKEEIETAGILNTIDKQNETKNKVEEKEPPKSTSPFFQEEEKPEVENPFFQQQINLIENQVPTSPTNNIELTNTKHYNVKIIKKKEPLIKLILGVLSYAMFIFLLLIGVTLLVYVIDIKIRQSKGDYSAPKFNAYVVLTGSMLPEIKVKDVVITKKTEGKDLKEGDVITFASTDSRFAGTIITHRIIKKNPKTDKEGFTFQTKGDNNNVADSALVTEGNIFGKVILKIPKLGYLQEFLAADGGWIIVILIPCLAVISYDIVKLAKGLKRKKYKNIKVQK